LLTKKEKECETHQKERRGSRKDWKRRRERKEKKGEELLRELAKGEVPPSPLLPLLPPPSTFTLRQLFHFPSIILSYFLFSFSMV